MIAGRLPFYQSWKRKGATFWKRRRFHKMLRLVELPEDRPIRVLEVGCANGRDFIQFTSERFDVWAVDQNECELAPPVHFIRADAAALPFPDKSFDLVVSVGLLEHIEPMEKLCQVIREMDRVGLHQVSVVPALSTPVEPHSLALGFPLRLHKELFGEQPGRPLHLNFFTDHSWTKFLGFSDCQVRRFFYLPPLILNTAIYK